MRRASSVFTLSFIVASLSWPLLHCAGAKLGKVQGPPPEYEEPYAPPSASATSPSAKPVPSATTAPASQLPPPPPAPVPAG